MAETQVINSQIQSPIVRHLSTINADMKKFKKPQKVVCPPIYSSKVTVVPNEQQLQATTTNVTTINAAISAQVNGPNQNMAPRNSSANMGGVYTFNVPEIGSLHRAVLKIRADVTCPSQNTTLSVLLTNKFGAYSAVESVELLCDNKVVETVYGRQMFAEMIDNSTGPEIDNNLSIAKWRNYKTGRLQPSIHIAATPFIGNTLLNPLILNLQSHLNIPLDCFKAVAYNLNSRVMNNLKIRVTIRDNYCSFRTGGGLVAQAYAADNYTNWLLYSNISTAGSRNVVATTDFVTGSNLVHPRDPGSNAIPAYEYSLRTWSGTVLVNKKTVPATTKTATPGAVTDTRTCLSSSNASTVSNVNVSMIMYFNNYSDATEAELFTRKIASSDSVMSKSTYAETPLPLVFEDTTIVSGNSGFFNANGGNNVYTNTPYCATFPFLDAVFSNNTSVRLECKNLASSIVTMCDTDDFPLHFMATVNTTTLKSSNNKIYNSDSPVENTIDTNNKRLLDGCSKKFKPGMQWFVGKYGIPYYNPNTISMMFTDTAISITGSSQYIGTTVPQQAPQSFSSIYFDKSEDADKFGGSLGLQTLVSPTIDVNIISNEFGTHLTPDYKVFTYVKYHQLLQLNKDTGNLAVVACT